MKKIFYLLFFLFISADICSADITVYPGSNVNSMPGDSIFLNGSISGLDGSGSDISSCGQYDYEWIDVNSLGLSITGAIGTGVTSTSFSANFVYPSGQSTVSIKLLVSIPIAVTCPFAGLSYSGVVNYYNPPANAGADATYNAGDVVYLSGSLGPPASCTTMYHYSWAQTSGTGVTISNSLGSSVCTSNSFTGASFVFPDIPVGDSVEFELTAFTTGTNYKDRVVYTRRVSTPVASAGSSSAGSSFIVKQGEAEDIFHDTGSISKIALHLELTTDKDQKSLSLRWNDVGGGGHVRYFLEYAAGANFRNPVTFAATESIFHIPVNSLDKKAQSHYFRVRAGYAGRYSPYSNIIGFYNDDILILPKYRDFLLSLNFLDVFHTPDALIDKHLQVSPKSLRIRFDTIFK